MLSKSKDRYPILTKCIAKARSNYRKKKTLTLEQMIKSREITFSSKKFLLHAEIWEK